MKKGLKYGLSILMLAGVFWFCAAAKNTDFKIGRNIEILINMFRDINLFYVDDVDADELLSDAANGMTGSLDPYSEYLPEKAMEGFEVMATGKYGGIGSLIREKGDYVVIAQPYKGSPADRAGLQIGDKIMAIDGKDAKNLKNSQVSSMLKGDPGTNVKLKIEKFYSGEIINLTIKRERIAIPGVPYYGFVSDSIGYIEHSDFTDGCADDMRKAYMEMSRSGKLKGLIIDYRGNGGGILQEAVKIVSFFVPKGTEVVTMKGRQKETSATYLTETDPISTQIPIVVLTNSNSASAAEIVSGSLQDLDRAVLVGQRTFGKGLVQSTRPIGYNSYLKLTTAKYYIPSGRCIQAIDYTHRNEDGSVDFVPDSLVREFTTKAGRKVYDGAGVMPDIKLKPEFSSRFAIVVYTKGYIDEFVDIWCKRHPEAVNLNSFKFSDVDYAEFEDFMKDKSVEFESETKRAIASLKQKAERERYLDKIAEHIAQIEKGIKDDKESNLKLYKNELSEIIEDEVILRHHYSQGVKMRRIKSDTEVDEAVKLLGDTKLYQEIITSRDTQRK